MNILNIIFIFCAEFLFSMILRAERDNLFQGIEVVINAMFFFYLLFADDFIFFIKAGLE